MNSRPFPAGAGTDAGGSGWRTMFLRNRYLLVLSIVVALALKRRKVILSGASP